MLDHLKRLFKANEKEQELTQETLSVEDNISNQEKLSELNTEQNETLTALQAEFAELTSKYEALQAQLSSVEADKATLLADQQAAKLTSRREKIELVVGTVKAPALLAATESLDDNAFNAVVAAMSSAAEQESKTDLFREVGTSGSDEALNSEEDVAARLAAKIEAQFNPK